MLRNSLNLLPLSFLLASLGGPAAALASFWEAAQSHPVVATGVIVAYEMFLAAWAFAVGVLRKLKGRWIERVSDWLDARILLIVSRERRRYLDYVRRTQRLDDPTRLLTRGAFAIELSDVFVELRLLPISPHQSSSDPLNATKASLRIGSHPIWSFLDYGAMRSLHLAILGPPGSGKTTLLRHTALLLASPTLAHRRIPDKLPVFLSLRKHAPQIAQKHGYTIADAVRHDLRAHPYPPDRRWLLKQLKDGSCIVLLDGLDEVADEGKRKLVASWVEEQIRAFGESRFVVSSRPHGYHSAKITGLTTLETCAFDTTQIDAFLKNWCLAQELGVPIGNRKEAHGRASASANALIERLREVPSLLELAINPLLLTMISMVHRYRGMLPNQRHSLYREIIEVLLDRFDESAPVDKKHAISLLSDLAVEFMTMGRREIARDILVGLVEDRLTKTMAWETGDAFLRQICSESGLLVEPDDGHVRFAHPSLCEYLAATMLVVNEEWLDEHLPSLVNDSWWREVMIFIALIRGPDDVVRACLDTPGLNPLILALECREQALPDRMDDDLRTRLDNRMKEGLNSPASASHRLVAEASLHQATRSLLQIAPDTYCLRTPVIRAHWDLYVEDSRDDHASGHVYELDHERDGNRGPVDSSMSVLGLRPSQAADFCRWLTERAQVPWIFRLPADREVEDAAAAVGVTPLIASPTESEGVQEREMFDEERHRLTGVLHDLLGPSLETVAQHLCQGQIAECLNADGILQVASNSTPVDGGPVATSPLALAMDWLNADPSDRIEPGLALPDLRDARALEPVRGVLLDVARLHLRLRGRDKPREHLVVVKDYRPAPPARLDSAGKERRPSRPRGHSGRGVHLKGLWNRLRHIFINAASYRQVMARSGHRAHAGTVFEASTTKDPIVRVVADGGGSDGAYVFEVPPGECHGIVAPPGSGGVRLFEQLTWMNTDGVIEATIAGIGFRDSPEEQLRARAKIGIALGARDIYPAVSVHEHAAAPLRYFTVLREEIIDIQVKIKLELLGMRRERERLGNALNEPERWAVSFARQIALDPHILFFYNLSPSLSPDPRSLAQSQIRLIGDLTTKLNATVVMVGADAKFMLEACDKLWYWEAGRLDGPWPARDAALDPRIMAEVSVGTLAIPSQGPASQDEGLLFEDAGDYMDDLLGPGWK